MAIEGITSMVRVAGIARVWEAVMEEADVTVMLTWMNSCQCIMVYTI